jgi:hypothetical protein
MEPMEKSSTSLSREELYALVWSEPMLKVAARFGVSSSYMARVCSQLQVPRPERGYWAKLEVGKAPATPGLPQLRPGAPTIWTKGGSWNLVSSPLPVPPKAPAEVATPARAFRQLGEHALIEGARAHFESGRLSYEGEYLKPAKKLLLDLTVTKGGLDAGLKFANQLFLALENMGHGVVIAAAHERFSRDAINEQEDGESGYNNLWSPGRCTLAYFGTVGIGLSIIEMSEEVEVRYVNGSYVRESEYVPSKRSRHAHDTTWTTKKHFGSGRLCLQAYSPYHSADWVHRWREKKPGELIAMIPAICSELERAAHVVAKLVEEGERRAEIERRRWEEEHARYERERAEQRALKAREESKADLLAIIRHWADSENFQRFFEEVERRASSLDEATRQQLESQLASMRALFPKVDPLAGFLAWKPPQLR